MFAESEQAFGVYGAWDRKKTQFKNYFNQFMVGGEYWIKNWFIGANYYHPIGNTEKFSQPDRDVIPSEASLAIGNKLSVSYEKAMPGADAEVGYEFIDGLMGYAGGYYFAANDVATVYGPRARLSYDWSPASGRILGIFDKVGVEAGIQRDKPRGTTGYLSVNVRVGWLFDKKSVLKGLSRHMIDPVRRDIDIVSGEAVSQKSEPMMSDAQVVAINIENGGDANTTANVILNLILEDAAAKGQHVSPAVEAKIREHIKTGWEREKLRTVFKHGGDGAAAANAILQRHPNVTDRDIKGKIYSQLRETAQDLDLDNKQKANLRLNKGDEAKAHSDLVKEYKNRGLTFTPDMEESLRNSLARHRKSLEESNEPPKPLQCEGKNCPTEEQLRRMRAANMPEEQIKWLNENNKGEYKGISVSAWESWGKKGAANIEDKIQKLENLKTLRPTEEQLKRLRDAGMEEREIEWLDKTNGWAPWSMMGARDMNDKISFLESLQDAKRLIP